MIGSSLVTYKAQAYSGNYTPGRAYYSPIQAITIHHTGSIMSIQTLCNVWQRVGRQGSSHYGVDDNGIGQYVSESDVAWTNSNWDSNCRSVTIETCNNTGSPYWTVADKTLDNLIKLVADIAKRNNLGELKVGKNLNLDYHSLYSATLCPGPYLLERMQDIADEANRINEGSAPETEPPVEPYTSHKLKIGYASEGDTAQIETLLNQLDIPFETKDGYTYTLVEPSEGDYNRIVALSDSLLGVGHCIPYESIPATTEVEQLKKELAEANEKLEIAEIKTVEAYTLVNEYEKIIAENKADAEKIVERSK